MSENEPQAAQHEPGSLSGSFQIVLVNLKHRKHGGFCSLECKLHTVLL